MHGNFWYLECDWECWHELSSTRVPCDEQCSPENYKFHQHFAYNFFANFQIKKMNYKNQSLCCTLFNQCSCNQLYHRDRVAQTEEVAIIQQPALPTHRLWLHPWLNSNNNLSQNTANSRKFKCHQLLISACCWVSVWVVLTQANWPISICRNSQCIWLVFLWSSQKIPKISRVTKS